MLAITERQLRSWEKQELIPTTTDYGFFDLLALRTIAKLRKSRISTAKIRSALVAMRDKLEGVENPLVELRIFSEGRKILVQVGGQQMEPVSGQLLLNFEADEIRKLVSFPGKNGEKEAARTRELQRAKADVLFQEALELEQCGATSDAVDAYREVLELDPAFAGAYVNLGTIFFTGRDLEEAEENYRQAIEADPEYALARFNMGNLYDELGNRPAALQEYQTALELDPAYADVHYNIALLFQSTGQVLKAVRHWKQYLKLDPGSPWASIARRELDRIYRETVVENTRSRG